MSKKPKQEPMATVAEIAAAVGVGTNTVRHRCKYGHLPGAMTIVPALAELKMAANMHFTPHGCRRLGAEVARAVGMALGLRTV
jgi:hypothetical protein